MKTLCTFIITILLLGCIPEAENSISNLDSIFAKNQFSIERGVYGCFGGNNFKFTLSKEGNYYLLTSREENFKKVLNQSQFDSIKSFAAGRINRLDNTLPDLCTGNDVLKVSSSFRLVEISENDCDTIWNYLDGILDVKKLYALRYPEQ